MQWDTKKQLFSFRIYLFVMLKICDVMQERISVFKNVIYLFRQSCKNSLWNAAITKLTLPAQELSTRWKDNFKQCYYWRLYRSVLFFQQLCYGFKYSHGCCLLFLAIPLTFDGKTSLLSLSVDSSQLIFDGSGSFTFRTRATSGTLLYMVSDEHSLGKL